MDNVNHPTHYNQNRIETIDIIEVMLSPEEFRGFIFGNIIKYMDRCNFKGQMEDLEKAQWYARKLVDDEECSENLENYKQWFVRLYEGQLEKASGLWEEFRESIG